MARWQDDSEIHTCISYLLEAGILVSIPLSRRVAGCSTPTSNFSTPHRSRIHAGAGNENRYGMACWRDRSLSYMPYISLEMTYPSLDFLFPGGNGKQQHKREHTSLPRIQRRPASATVFHIKSVPS
jgi:hypothetical protein